MTENESISDQMAYNDEVAAMEQYTLEELLDGVTDDNVHGEIAENTSVDDTYIIEQLRLLADDDQEADRLLCSLLYALGYSNVVDAYYKAKRWYS